MSKRYECWVVEWRELQEFSWSYCPIIPYTSESEDELQAMLRHEIAKYGLMSHYRVRKYVEAA